MDKPIEVFEHPELGTLEIWPDEDAQNPRTDWGEPFGTMICWHRRDSYGDEQPTLPPLEWLAEHLGYGYDGPDYSSGQFHKWWDKQAIVMTVYMYDHSGVVLSTTPFSCPWDSGAIGYIYVDIAKVKNEYGWKHMSKKRREKIRERLDSEVEVYSQWLSGDVYGFVVKDKDGNETDSCWGFYGTDYAKNGMLEHIDARWAEVVK